MAEKPTPKTQGRNFFSVCNRQSSTWCTKTTIKREINRGSTRTRKKTELVI